ncbi:DUF4153 domain-containing protein [Pedobacter sp. SYP-B3415]|uniref:DUF4153 domain-containing protein n=1 Tax=Pedobacter sp. SYP-B3415 TaxID=2496641 RepID=UPI00101D460A|nr:DUF4153 domain-containing protein [Pedobacter sp. SYP-B3415]
MALKFPSFNHIFRQLFATAKRFPFESLIALAGTLAAMIYTTDGYGYRIQELALRVLMTALVGGPLMLAVTLFCGSSAPLLRRVWILKSFAAVAASCLFFAFRPEEYPQHAVQCALLILAVHLLVSFAPFIKSNDTSAFWYFNKVLCIRLLTGGLYSAVLAAGLSAAFAVVDKIFFHMDWHYLSYIWIASFGIFNTLYFLSGVPDNPGQEAISSDYPLAIKFFSQYILVPLTTVYLFILLAYEIKILIEWRLPNGMVSGLVLGYATLGILALLLVYPIREASGNKWIRIYSRYFYLFLIPLVALLIAAVARRVDNYGITHYRYFLLVIAVWLVFIIIYFLRNKSASIKTIPVSLFLITLLTIYGPQSATSLTLYAQRHILAELFTQENSIKDGKLIPINENTVKVERALRMANTLNYILRNYHFNALQPLIHADMAQVGDSLLRAIKHKDNHTPDTYTYAAARTGWVFKYLNLTSFQYPHISDSQVAQELVNTYRYETKQDVKPLQGFDYMLPVDLAEIKSQTDTLAGFAVKREIATLHGDQAALYIGKTKFDFNLTDMANAFIKHSSQMDKYFDVHPDHGPVKQYVIPQQLLTLQQTKGNITVRFMLEYLQFDHAKRAGVSSLGWSGCYLIKIDRN